MGGIQGLLCRALVYSVAFAAVVCSAFAAPALARTRAAAVNSTASYYLYGLVCGECDAAHAKSAVANLRSASYAMSYIKDPAHRQQMPRGEALSLDRKAQRASRHVRYAYLNAFIAGYKRGWQQTAQHEKTAGKSAPLEATLYQPMGNPHDPSLANMRTLGLAVRLYLSDHNNTFPRMVNPQITDKYLQTYLVDDNAFYEPGTDSPYQPNIALENKHIIGYTNWGKIVAFYEPIPAADGSRCVLFVDGTVARVPAAQWAKLKEDSGVVDYPD
jgi:hypothetical protein